MGYLSPAEINWSALKQVLQSDIKIFSDLAAKADHGPEGDVLRSMYGAKIVQARDTLDSMATIEKS